MLRNYADNPLISALKEWLLENGRDVSVAKNGFFSQAGESPDKVGIVIHGSFAMCSDNEKGHRAIFSIAFAGEFISNYLAHSVGQPCVYDIQALENSVVRVADVSDIDRIFLGHKPEEKCDFMSAMAYGMMRRIISLKCDTPLKRYQSLLERIPDVHQKVSMTALSAYLGLSREAFQRMKRTLR